MRHARFQPWKRPAWLVLVAILVVAAGCAADPQSAPSDTSEPPSDSVIAQPDDTVPADERTVRIDAHSFHSVDNPPSAGLTAPVAVFDDVELARLENSLAFGMYELLDVSLVGDVDWGREMVLLTITDACQPVEARLLISTTDIAVDLVQDNETVCEALTPYASLFIVPQHVETADGTVVFAPDSVPDIEGQPVTVPPPSRLDGVTPVGVYIQRDTTNDAPSDGATFFELGGDAAAELVGRVVGVNEDEDSYPAGLQAQLNAVGLAEEFVLVVAYSACAPIGFELVPADGGFVHTTFQDPSINCVWAPQHAVVYVVPRQGPDGVRFTEDNQPEITFETVDIS